MDDLDRENRRCSNGLALILETVWDYTHGTHFVYTACLNSMADNLCGMTLHKCWWVPFQNSSGAYVSTKGDEESWTDVLTRLELLHWSFRDGIETAANTLVAFVEDRQLEYGGRHDQFQRINGDSCEVKRPWASVNVLMTGDFLECSPTRGVVFISDPLPHTTSYVQKSIRFAGMAPGPSRQGALHQHSFGQTTCWKNAEIEF